MVSLENPHTEISKCFLMSRESITDMANWEIVLENCQSGVQTTSSKGVYYDDGGLLNICDDNRLGVGYYIVRGIWKGIEKANRISDNLYEYNGEAMIRLDNTDALTIMHRLLRAKNDRVRELLAEKSDYIDYKTINNVEY